MLIISLHFCSILTPLSPSVYNHLFPFLTSMSHTNTKQNYESKQYLISSSVISGYLGAKCESIWISKVHMLSYFIYSQISKVLYILFIKYISKYLKYIFLSIQYTNLYIYRQYSIDIQIFIVLYLIFKYISEEYIYIQIQSIYI